jgi:glycosyltransferase involved in cell wall biosynthesis
MRKVAIGIPVYNGSNFVGAAIESILAQTWGDFDLFISDNASTDATEEICRGYATHDGRIQYVRQARNLGAAGNYNILVSMTESPYFKWAAHDDVVAPGFLAACVEALDRDPAVVLASPASALIGAGGALLPYSTERRGLIDEAGVCWPMLPEKNPGLAADDPAARFEAVMINMVMCVEIFGLMRRSALLRTALQGPFGGADKVLLAQMSLLGRFWLGEETLFFRRCHAEQFSASVSGAYRAQWFSGRRDTMFTQQFRLLLAYLRALHTTDLTIRQRRECLQAIARRALFRGQQWRRLTGALVGQS